jgi:thiamine kinase-like enzyme
MKNNVKIKDKYVYVCLGKINEYYYKQISIIEVIKFLFLYNKIFGQRFRINYSEYSLKWVYNLLHFHRNILKKNFIQLVRVLKYKFGLRSDDGQLNIRHFGEYCIVVNKGFKIFNFKNKTVKKIFRDEIAEGIVLREIEILKKSQNTRLAPKLIQWNTKEKWHEEELINGSRDFSHYPRSTKSLIKKFRTSINPALQEIIFSAPIESFPLTQRLKLYSNKITEVLNSAQNEEIEIKDEIKKFVDIQISILGKETNATIFFGFSHGDFCPANILNTSKEINLIDWEGAGIRSILYDFYSYFFYRPTHQIFNDFYGLVKEINQALGILIANIDPKFKELRENIAEKNNIYRVVYYIERTIMLTERISQDEKLNIKKIILDFIDAFEKYEAEYKAPNFVKMSNIGN